MRDLRTSTCSNPFVLLSMVQIAIHCILNDESKRLLMIHPENAAFPGHWMMRFVSQCQFIC
jgi:hypothetical protein